MVFLMYLHIQNCLLISKYFCFKLADPCFSENAKIFFHLKWLFCYRYLMGWQRDDHDCVEESCNQIKLMNCFFGVSVCVCGKV